MHKNIETIFGERPFKLNTTQKAHEMKGLCRGDDCAFIFGWFLAFEWSTLIIINSRLTFFVTLQKDLRFSVQMEIVTNECNKNLAGK